MTDKPDSQAIIDVMKDLHEPRPFLLHQPNLEEGITAIAVPKGMELKSVKPFFDEYRDRPERRRGQATLTTLDSFIAHTNRFKGATSIVYGQRDEMAPGVLSVLDYHGEGPADTALPSFGQHRGHYAFPLSKEWQAWARIDGETMNQAKFADFIEERILDVSMPPQDGRSTAGALALDLKETIGGDFATPQRMVELSRGLTIHENSTVGSTINLASGEGEITFRATHVDAQGQPMRVPTMFLVRIPVFDGDAAYEMPVRIRYRKSGAALAWTLHRYRPDIIFLHAFDAALAKVKAETELPVLLGSPEK